MKIILKKISVLLKFVELDDFYNANAIITIFRNNHNTQLKEQAVVEQEIIEPEKQSPEKIKLAEEFSENSEESNICPMQSKLQHLFSNNR